VSGCSKDELLTTGSDAPKNSNADSWENTSVAVRRDSVECVFVPEDYSFCHFGNERDV